MTIPTTTRLARGVFLAACATSLSFLNLTGPAHALDAALENIVMTDGDNQIQLGKVGITGANLTQDELAKLFSSATPTAERKALAARLKAERIDVPAVVLTNKTTRLTFNNVKMAGVTDGRAAEAGFSDAAGTGTSADGAVTDIKAGALAIADADLSALFNPAGAFAFSRLSLDGLSVTGADTSTPATAVGGNRFTVRFGRLDAEAAIVNGVLTRSGFALKQLAILPPPASELGGQLAAAGYEKLELGLDYAATYDPAARTLTLDKLALTGLGAGALQVRALFGGVDPSLMTKSAVENVAGLLAANVRSVDISLDDSGIVEKSIGFGAAQQQKAPAAFRAEAAAMARQIIPVFIGGAPNALQIADAVSKFITVPSTMTIAMKPKNGSLGALDIMQIDSPAAFIAKVDLDVRIGAASMAAVPAAASSDLLTASPRKSEAPVVAQAPAGTRKLVGLEAWSALVGNTIAGKNADGDPFFEYYLKDGSVKQLDDDEVATGEWTVKGSNVCFEFPEDDEETCYKVAVDGKIATFTDEDGKGRRFEILAGNPKKL